MGAALNTELLTPLPKWLMAEHYADLHGTTKKAVERKCQDGVWREGVEWIIAPDGRRRINWRAVDLWIEGNPLSP